LEIKATARISESAKGERCPYCLDSVTPDDLATCDRCGTKHHASCFSVHGQCTILGCNGQVAERASLLDEKDQRNLLKQAKGLQGNVRVRAVERLCRNGVPLALIESYFGKDPDGRIQASILGAKLRKGDDRARIPLIELALNQGEQVQNRAAALRALVLQHELPKGVVQLALTTLEQGSLKNRAEWILRSCNEAEFLEIFDLVRKGRISPALALKGLIATYSGYTGPERSARIGQLESVRDSVQGDLAHVIIDAAKAKNEVLLLPSVPPPTDTTDVSANLRHAAMVTVLSFSILLLAWLIGRSGGTGAGPAAIWTVARTVTAFMIAVTTAFAMILSSKKTADLRLREQITKKRKLAEGRFKKGLDSKAWNQAEKAAVLMDEHDYPPIFDPTMRKPGQIQARKATS
jgi:hypothetical protein